MREEAAEACGVLLRGDVVRVRLRRGFTAAQAPSPIAARKPAPNESSSSSCA